MWSGGVAAAQAASSVATARQIEFILTKLTSMAASAVKPGGSSHVYASASIGELKQICNIVTRAAGSLKSAGAHSRVLP